MADLPFGAQVDTLLPSVLMSHYTVAGCEYDNGQQHIFTQNEVILPREAIAASPFDLVCLGHIHKAQEVENCGRPVFYSGAINGLTFKEEGQDKGFWMHEIKIEPYDNVDSRFVKTPYREYLTETLDEQNIKTILEYLGENPTWLMGTIVKDKIIRVHYTCSDELNKQLNRKALEKEYYEAGAFYVAEIKPVQINTALTKQELTENAGPLENLRNWCRAEGFTPEDTLSLEILARPLIDTVSAKMPTGKLSGVFVPRRLEVKNYRSYREASFDFSQINFATVNGPNGVGKSALFMDAISDCLYEETREGEITGWITNGEKSGMITFEFSMGESTWRVIRTRARSGKTTLALQEQAGGQWTDRSAEKVRDTQDKIIALLGIVATATERIKSLDVEIVDKEDQAGAAEGERNKLLVMSADLDTTKLNVTNLQHYIDGLDLDKNVLHVRQGGVTAKLEALAADEGERKQVAEKMAPAAATLTRYQTLAKAFGQDGIPFSIIRTVVPELSAQANEILGQMTGGKMSLEMKTERLQKNKKEVNTLEIWINGYQWGNMPYRSRSGGQKVRAALSVAFALAELKAARAGIRLGMLFIDESPFLDANGAEHCNDRSTH